jgi:hypothetical protein
MNERIKELELRAYVEVTESWRDPSSGYVQEITGKKFSREQFAKLIVRECLAHGKLTQSQAVVNGSEEYNAGREMGIEVFMNQIKKHFGVEE